MIVCPQCLGKKATNISESLIDINSNTETFQNPGPNAGATPCSQCAGVGYY